LKKRWAFKPLPQLEEKSTLQQPSKTPSFHHKACRGAPGSQMRTWVKQAGRSPSLISLMVQQTSHTDASSTTEMTRYRQKLPEGTSHLRKNLPQSTNRLQPKLGPDRAKRMSSATTTGSTMKIPGATGNHHRSTLSRSRKSVEAANARNRTAEKMMYDNIRSKAPKTALPAPVKSAAK
jgi:hypothetical protein